MGSGWGAGAKTLRIATLSLVYTTAEYCAPVWCRSTVNVLPGSVLLCPGPVPGLLGWGYPAQLGLSLTYGLVLSDSIRPCTNGVLLLHRIASVAPLNKPHTMYQREGIWSKTPQGPALRNCPWLLS